MIKLIEKHQIETLLDENIQLDECDLSDGAMYLEFSYDIEIDSYFLFVEFFELDGEINYSSHYMYRYDKSVLEEAEKIRKEIINELKKMIENKYRLLFETGVYKGFNNYLL
jgi:hypothetical protein